MIKRRFVVGLGLLALAGGGFFFPAWESGRPTIKFKYEAEEGIPKDQAAEKRRDYAVLEATLNDLASPMNPEYKNHIKNVGPGREIVIDAMTTHGELFGIDLSQDSYSLVGIDVRKIPVELQEDFKRRNQAPRQSLTDFKPSNPNILILDLDKMFKAATDPIEEFHKKYPKAWGVERVYLPAYSVDGNSALVVTVSAFNYEHALYNIYMLTKKTKQWEVQWRHFRPTT